MNETELELLLALDGASFEMAPGILVEFAVQRTEATSERPHGINYALVLRQKEGWPWLRFDNAHAVPESRRGFRRRQPAFDHWHRTESDKGRPYEFTTATKLLDDFWREVKRVLDERGIPHDL